MGLDSRLHLLAAQCWDRDIDLVKVVLWLRVTKNIWRKRKFDQSKRSELKHVRINISAEAQRFAWISVSTKCIDPLMRGPQCIQVREPHIHKCCFGHI